MTRHQDREKKKNRYLTDDDITISMSTYRLKRIVTTDLVINLDGRVTNAKIRR